MPEAFNPVSQWDRIVLSESHFTFSTSFFAFFLFSANSFLFCDFRRFVGPQFLQISSSAFSTALCSLSISPGLFFLSLAPGSFTISVT